MNGYIGQNITSALRSVPSDAKPPELGTFSFPLFDTSRIQSKSSTPLLFIALVIHYCLKHQALPWICYLTLSSFYWPLSTWRPVSFQDLEDTREVRAPRIQEALARGTVWHMLKCRVRLVCTQLTTRKHFTETHTCWKKWHFTRDNLNTEDNFLGYSCNYPFPNQILIETDQGGAWFGWKL